MAASAPLPEPTASLGLVEATGDDNRHTVFDFPWAPVPEALLYDASVSATAVRIWGALARFGMTPESCYPSHEQIGERIGMAGRSVARPLRELEQHGWLRRFPRYDERGRISDGYELLSRKSARQSRAEMRATPRAGSREEREPLIPIEEPLRGSSCEPPESARPKAEPSFDDFWSVYPRKVGKAAARKAFDKATKKAEAREVCNAAWRLARDPNLPETQFVPHPATWLNRGGWEDEPLPTRTNGKGSTAVQRTRDNLIGFMGGDSDGDNERGRSGADGTRRGLPR